MKWTIEYSCIQKCFHIDTYENTLKRNYKECYNETFTNDYKIIAIVDDYNYAIDFVNKIKKDKENTF